MDDEAKRYRAWSQARGLVEVCGLRAHIERLWGGPGSRRVGAPGRLFRVRAPLPRWADHCRVWRRGDRIVVATCEPYGLSQKARAEIDRLARAHRLEHVIRPPPESLHLPGRTWLVELWVAGAQEAGDPVR
jgi:hypothetical protein